MPSQLPEWPTAAITAVSFSTLYIGPMCTRYVSPEERAIDRQWRIDRRTPWRVPGPVFPGYKAPFIRADRDSTEPRRELVIGQWNLIPHFAKAPKLTYATCNARSEELSDKASYKTPWARGQRCVIPAEVFFEPNWESGKHVPWWFRPAAPEFGGPDGIWGLAGIWNTWTDRATGEVHESYSMLTINADGHLLMGRMHRPDPKRPPNMQDKRSVIPLAVNDIDLWLHGTIADASLLVKLQPAEIYQAGPEVKQAA